MNTIRFSDEPQAVEEPMQANSVEGDVMTPLLERSIGNVLGLEKDGDFSRYAPKIRTLLEYAKGQTQDHSPENLKWVIRSLELKLGTPPFAEKRINYVARYAWLMQEEKRITQEKQQFEQNI